MEYKELANLFVEQLSALANIPKQVVEKPVNRFFESFTNAPAIKAAAMVYRDPGYFRPIVDIYFLWSPAVDKPINDERGPLYDPIKAHGHFAEEMETYIDTLLNTVDLRNTSMGSFRKKLLGLRAEPGVNRRVLLLAQIN